MKKKRIVVLILILAILGVAFEISSARFQPKVRFIKSYDAIGNSVQREDIYIPFISILFSVLGTTLLTFSGALIVSKYVTSKIEQHQIESEKEELVILQGNIRQDVYDSVFKKLMPDEIFAIIRQDVITAPFIKRDVSWELDFSLVDNDRKVLLNEVSRWEFHNISHLANKHEIVVKIIPNSGNNETVRFTCLSISDEQSNSIAEINTADPTGNNCVKTHTDPSSGAITYSVDLSISPHSFLRITRLTETLYPVETVSGGYHTLYPIIHASLSVKYPSGYEFALVDNSSTRFKPEAKTATTAFYRCLGAIYPQQGYSYSLIKR